MPALRAEESTRSTHCGYTLSHTCQFRKMKMQHLAVYVASAPTISLWRCGLWEPLFVGAAYESLGQLDGADRSYRHAKLADPRLVSAYNNHGIVLKQRGAVPEALKSFRTGIELEPKRAQTWYNYGITLQERERWAEALEAYDKALYLEPIAYRDDPSILANRGLSLLELPGRDRTEDGKKSLRRAVFLQPTLMDHPTIREAL